MRRGPHRRLLKAASAFVASCVVPCVVSPVRAQVVVLDRPQATLSEPFSYVRGARELSNGALLAVDWIENRLVLADFATDRSRDVMREGRGPRELRLPSGLVRLRGDTTLLWDDGNNRAHILAPDGRSLRTIPTEAPGRGGIRGMDASGGYLHVVPSWAEGPNALPDDSVRIVRWDGTRTGEARVVAVVQGTRYRKDRSPALKPRLPMVGFAAQDAWVVAIDGSLVIVRANPYHVEVHPPNGPVVQGPAVPYDRRVVSAEDRRRFIREFAARSPVSGRGPDGSLGRGEAIDEAEVERMAGTAEWAEQFPPFDAGAVIAGADGRIWVGRAQIPGVAPRYDVFDRRGRIVLQVSLRPGRRVVEVGARGVYAVAEDADGIQTIERYRLP